MRLLRRPRLVDYAADGAVTAPETTIAHYFFGAERVAICGARLEGAAAPEGHELCVVCQDLIWSIGR